jgi:hypothetical protein
LAPIICPFLQVSTYLSNVKLSTIQSNLGRPSATLVCLVAPDMIDEVSAHVGGHCPKELLSVRNRWFFAVGHSNPRFIEESRRLKRVDYPGRW